VVLLACRSPAAERDVCVRNDLCLALARAAPSLRPRELGEARRFATQQAGDGREQVRATAVRALAALGARDRVEAALQDSSRAVKYAALRALGRSTRALARRHPPPTH
jgi:HEAT repeat protein